MKSIKLVVIVVLILWTNTSLEENLKLKICDQTIDSAAKPFGQKFVYLSSGHILFKMEIDSEERAVVRWAKKLSKWSEHIKPPVTMMYTAMGSPKHINLINCESTEEWIIDYSSNKLIGSNKPLIDCSKDSVKEDINFEFILDQKMDVSLNYKLIYRSSIDIVVYNMNSHIQYFIRKLKNTNQIKRLRIPSDKNERIEGFDETEPFMTLNGHEIKSAFIYGDHWFFFGGQFYCRVKLNDRSFQTCEPILISDWISDCHGSELDSKEHKNKDISMFVIILVVIVVIAVIAIVIIGLFIFREVNRKGTSSASRPGSSSSSI